MKFIDDHIREVVRGPPPQLLRVVGLNRAEQVLFLLGFSASNQQVSEVVVTEHRAKGAECLPQDLLAMGDEQKRRFGRGLTTNRGIIECRNHRFARSRGGYDKVSELLLNLSLCGDDVEDFLLKWVRA